MLSGSNLLIKILLYLIFIFSFSQLKMRSVITSDNTDIVNNQNIRLPDISGAKTVVYRNKTLSEVPSAVERKFIAEYCTDNKAVNNNTYL